MLVTTSESSGACAFGDPLTAVFGFFRPSFPFVFECKNNKSRLFTMSITSGEMFLSSLLLQMSNYHILNLVLPSFLAECPFLVRGTNN